MRFANRQEARHVLETMDALVASLNNFLNDETKERVSIAMRILHDTKIGAVTVNEDIVTREAVREEFNDFIRQNEHYHPYSQTIPINVIESIIKAIPGAERG